MTSPAILSLPFHRQHSDRDPATPSCCHDPQRGGSGEGGARGWWTAVPPPTGGHCGSFPPAQPSDGPRNTPGTAGSHSVSSKMQHPLLHLLSEGCRFESHQCFPCCFSAVTQLLSACHRNENNWQLNCVAKKNKKRHDELMCCVVSATG